MNEELIRQFAREAYRAAYGRDIPPYNDIGKFAKELLELHHARHVAPLVEAAREAERTFRHYAELHAAKATPDGDAKAKRNRELAENMAAAHSAFRKGDA